MSSALFDANGEFYNDKRPTYIGSRGTSIPSFYEPHSDLRVMVRQDGIPVPPGFQLGDVPPERRWAVRPSGELIPQIEFERLYLLHYEEHIRYMDGDPKKVPGKANCQPVPTVQAYVCVQLDPRDPSKLITMKHDPFPKKVKQANQTLYDADGENPVSGDARIQMLMDAYEKDPDSLTELELREVIKRQRADQRKQEPAPEPKPEPKAVSPVAETDTPPQKKPFHTTMPCGEYIHASKKAKHMASCHECNEVTSGPDAA